MVLVFFCIGVSCVFNKKDPKAEHLELRKQLFGKVFFNKDVQSVDVLEISHPMLGGVLDTLKLSPNQQEVLLTKLDQVSYKGLYKCMSRYVIRFNFLEDTLCLKVCGDLIAHRNSDSYFEFLGGEEMMRKLIKQ